MLDFEDHFYFYDSLREVAKDLDVVWDRIDELQGRLSECEGVLDRVSVLGELGFLLRVAGDFSKAEVFLKSSIGHIEEEDLGMALYVVHSVRLASVWQWQREFEKSTDLLNQVLELCQSKKSCERYLDFCFQHIGKNLFDQKKYEDAHLSFTNALAIRKKKGNAKLVASTKLAIERTEAVVASLPNGD